MQNLAGSMAGESVLQEQCLVQGGFAQGIGRYCNLSLRKFSKRLSMFQKQIVLAVLGLSLSMMFSGCGKAEKEKQEVQLKMQADKARIDLQEKADALARNPPPELIKAAKEQAAAAANAGQKN